MAQPHGNEWRQTMRGVAPYLGLGMQLAAAVLVFFFAGWWVDATYATKPYGVLAGVAVGLAGGMVKFIRTVTSDAFLRDVSRDDERH